MSKARLLQGDSLEVLRTLPSESVHCVVTSPPYWGLRAVLGYNVSMDRDKGRFIKGSHWREPKPFWDAEWLRLEYVEKGRSSQEIADQFGCRDSNIQYWLAKHGIPRRTTAETRSLKHWGSSREANPMFGKRGAESATWKGGTTPDRQALYSRCEWNDVINAVWERDKGVCRRCGRINFNRRYMHAHHIIEFENEAGRLDVSKIVLLCSKCHGWVHSKDNVNLEWLERG